MLTDLSIRWFSFDRRDFVLESDNFFRPVKDAVVCAAISHVLDIYDIQCREAGGSSRMSKFFSTDSINECTLFIAAFRFLKEEQ